MILIPAWFIFGLLVGFLLGRWEKKRAKSKGSTEEGPTV
jgi:hypothetical protein